MLSYLEFSRKEAYTSLPIDFSWYHGKVDRGKAEDLLRRKHTGTYLVRDSSSIPGDFVLSVRYVSNLEYLKIVDSQ